MRLVPHELYLLAAVLGLLASSLLLHACGGDSGGPIDAGGTTSMIDSGTSSPRDSGTVTLPDAGRPADAATGADANAGPDAAMSLRVGTCSDPVPTGAPEPDPLPTYAGSCPQLVAGRNVIPSSGANREFILVLPETMDPTVPLPLVFMWHWLGGSAESFVEKGEVQRAADELGLIAVLPEAKGDVQTRWPFLTTVTSDARVNEEVRFFDDMLACVAEQYAVNRQCVSSSGVSAGALWTAQLAQRRANLLSSIISLSGGVGTGSILQPVRPWGGASHAMPALVLWGGPTDFCGVDFNMASMALENGLVAGHHYIVECIHNCSHAQPPLESTEAEGIFNPIWRFALDHPYWLADGVSPWMMNGLPARMPTWCAQGAGSATIRTGDCDTGILGSCN